MTSFHELGVSARIAKILTELQFVTPTPIQARAIPPALQGKDMIGIAQTGTGKTLAFGIPMIEHLAVREGKGLVVVPTRELALQVHEVCAKIAHAMHLSTAVLIGGASMHMQRAALRRNPRMIIATPGRLLDHLETRTVNLRDVAVLVLDEADRMLDMGFAPQINKILSVLPKHRQTMLFSATMPNTIVDMITKHMRLPVRVEIARPGTTAERVQHELFIVKKEDKPRLLEKLLYEYKGTTLVFSRTKYGTKRMCRDIREMGHTAAELHSNRTLAQRREALEGFKSGIYRVLVATDIAARGIDVKNIALVINYDVPENPEDYVHRIGRTGRAGSLGHAITFATPEQRSDVRDIERLVKFILPRKELPELPPVRPFRKHNFSSPRHPSPHHGREERNSHTRAPRRGNFRSHMRSSRVSRHRF